MRYLVIILFLCYSSITNAQVPGQIKVDTAKKIHIGRYIIEKNQDNDIRRIYKDPQALKRDTSVKSIRIYYEIQSSQLKPVISEYVIFNPKDVDSTRVLTSQESRKRQINGWLEILYFKSAVKFIKLDAILKNYKLKKSKMPVCVDFNLCVRPDELYIVEDQIVSVTIERDLDKVNFINIVTKEGLANQKFAQDHPGLIRIR